MKPAHSLIMAAAIAGLLSAAPAAGQSSAGGDAVGTWSGLIEEEGADTPAYTLTVSIDRDQNGDPVGTAAYSLGCQGVWIMPGHVTRGLEFDETVTAGRDNCAPHVYVEAEVRGNVMDVVLRTAGTNYYSRGTLFRMPD